MERKFYQDLVEWKNSKDRKPLLVVGARQVGKTYIIEKFCRENYKKTISINLIDDDYITNLFKKENTNFDEKCRDLSIHLNTDLTDKDTILFVDEVQESEDFIEALRFFYEKGNNYNIICAGSLLGVKLKRFNKSFPVGRVNIKTMYPLDFKEFLTATGNERYIDLIEEHYKNNEPLSDAVHEKIMRVYYDFLYLGGMPKVIQDYINNENNIVNCDRNIISDIVEEYITDMGKYNINKNESKRIQRIYEGIPNQLIKENDTGNVNKFVFSRLDRSDNRKRDYVTSLDWLIECGLVLENNLVTLPEYPLKGYVNNDCFKLYVNDTGILGYLVDIAPGQIILEENYKYKGVFAENYVATELIKLGYKLYYWSNTGARSEIDFIIQNGTSIIPIEVKAGTKDKAKSLGVYISKFNPEYSIKISTNNFGFNNGIKTIPLYATFCLGEKDLM